MNIKLLVAAVAVAPLFLSGSADASGGSPPLVQGPCIILEALNAGTKVSGPSELKFKVTSCSTSRQSIPTVVTDSAYRTLYPSISCGESTYAGPTLTVDPGDTEAFSIITRRGTCAIGASETHNLTLTAFAPDGSVLATGYTSWYEASRAEGI